MFKKNQVVAINYKGLGPRLACVRSNGVRKDGTVNIMMALYARSSVFSDCVVEPHEIEPVDVPYSVWQLLAWCLPQPDADDVMCRKQAEYEAAHPGYTAWRKCYEPHPFNA
jgi:hypothetical protein